MSASGKLTLLEVSFTFQETSEIGEYMYNYVAKYLTSPNDLRYLVWLEEKYTESQNELANKIK